ncbi:hypothetical protein [Clostridium butyricum]|uniref:Uncharacterized protein n=1 Tax=Clostridium butyricum E4 str. BoNT E BL5262 TaxID=632245 RepID=C4II56_CLOBU|nr:hypothetical protein [Clostridium butyricum]EDT75821.1 hypothetical protein CBY_2856 [Clostridium butyricum 5521]EEP54405.1 hypothetical protein CLP_2940 [Clostridium butyricum E4 str. BoNT E BL5262]NFL33142.1 hypothetical protein [Clostridium butyricum]NFS20281.1 hypothetical protein [Clostridium butyricum]
MANSRLPRAGDKVKIVNCKAALKNQDRVFTVKASPYVLDRKLVVVLKEIRGYFEAKHLEIVK